MTMVPIGRMDRRLTLRARTVTKDSMGGVVEAWADLETVWGQKRDTTGREFIAAAQENAELTTRFVIRWRNDVKPAMRIVYDGQDYDIVSCSELGRRQWLDIVAVLADRGTEIDPEEVEP